MRNTTKKIATVQHVVKKQKTIHESPTNVKMDEEFNMSETEKSGSEMNNGGCLFDSDKCIQWGWLPHKLEQKLVEEPTQRYQPQICQRLL
ncbi:hypothetical protein F442_05379 [Phytophthora nicotianae P10297]|nr:hypothetical protein F442_05379 [Phytophthora nicotianae P10297]